MAYRIPFNRPTRTDRDLANVQEALANGHLSGDGRFTKHCHRVFDRRTAHLKIERAAFHQSMVPEESLAEHPAI